MTHRDEILEIGQLNDVLHKLPDFTEWEKLGLNLGLHQGKLSAIEEDGKKNADRLSKVIQVWLRRNYQNSDNEPPTWGNLVKALKPIDKALALKIEEKLCAIKGSREEQNPFVVTVDSRVQENYDVMVARFTFMFSNAMNCIHRKVELEQLKCYLSDCLPCIQNDIVKCTSADKVNRVLRDRVVKLVNFGHLIGLAMNFEVEEALVVIEEIKEERKKFFSSILAMKFAKVVLEKIKESDRTHVTVSLAVSKARNDATMHDILHVLDTVFSEEYPLLTLVAVKNSQLTFVCNLPRSKLAEFTELVHEKEAELLAEGIVEIYVGDVQLLKASQEYSLEATSSKQLKTVGKSCTLSARMSYVPIEMIVLERHERELIDFMQMTIDRVKRELFSKGMIDRTNIAEEYETLTKKARMSNVLEFILTRMIRESEEESKQTFDNFLDTLAEELAWEFLRDSLLKAAEDQKKTSIGKKPWVKVFREKLSMMVDLLYASVTGFPSTLAAHGIHLDDATRDQAINPKPDAAVTVKVLDIVKVKVKRDPEKYFKKFIQCLEDADGFFFEDVISVLEKDLDQAKREQSKVGEGDKCEKEADEMMDILEKV